MTSIAVIPARYDASRFPGKLLQKLGDKTVLAHTYLAVKNSNLFQKIIIATDDKRIVDAMKNYNAEVVMTSPHHLSGSDRIAEAVASIDVDIIVNVQGDEPFIHPQTLSRLLNAFESDIEKMVDVATLKEQIFEFTQLQSPDNVKVVCDNNDMALYFSRSVIPFDREKSSEVTYFKHVGIYAYRKSALMQFTKLKPGKLEHIEKLEQLRYLENGFKIKVLESKHKTIGIDTPQDLELAKNYLKQMEQ